MCLKSCISYYSLAVLRGGVHPDCQDAQKETKLYTSHEVVGKGKQAPTNVVHS